MDDLSAPSNQNEQPEILVGVKVCDINVDVSAPSNQSEQPEIDVGIVSPLTDVATAIFHLADKYVSTCCLCVLVIELVYTIISLIFPLKYRDKKDVDIAKRVEPDCPVGIAYIILYPEFKVLVLFV